MSSSWDALSLVRSRKFGSPTAKLVMILMACRVDERWSCFIGQKRLGDEVEVTDRTVREWQSVFEQAGLIRRQKRYVGRGRTSDLITLVRSAIESLPIIDSDLPEGRSARPDLPDAVSASSPDLPEIQADLQEVEDRSSGSGVPGKVQRRLSKESSLVDVARVRDGTTAAVAAPLGCAPADTTTPHARLIEILESVAIYPEHEKESYTHRELLDATERLFHRLTQDQRDDMLFDIWFGRMSPEERRETLEGLWPPEVRLIADLIDDLVEVCKESEQLYPLDDWDLLSYRLTPQRVTV